MSDPVARLNAALELNAQVTLDGVAASESRIQTLDWIGHGRTPGSDCGQHPRVGRWAQAEARQTSVNLGA